MRSSTTRRNLCTLSTLFRSHPTRKPSLFSHSSISQHHDDFASDLNLSVIDFNPSSTPEDSGNVDDVTSQLSSILYSPLKNGPAPQETDDCKEKRKQALHLPWLLDLSHGNMSVKRKEVTRERKQKWIFNYTGNDRFDRLVKMCTSKLGTGATLDLFGKLGRATGVKEYNALIKVCIKNARETDDEYVAIEEMSKAFHTFKSMRECGFPLEEITYRPLLRYLNDMGLVQEFQLFSDVIKAENPRSASRLGYYEMMLWIRVNNEEMIRDICEYITVEDSEDTSALRESYLLALCESDRKTQIVDVLKHIDITKLSSAESIANIFQSLGRLLLESLAENLLLDLRARDHDSDDISNFIASYAVGIPNLAVEDIVSKIKYLHQLLEVLPSSSSYEKLILYCCDIRKVDVALDVVDKMCEAGFTLSTEVLRSILQICLETFEYNLVYRIYSIIRRYHLELNNDICRYLVHFCVRMKDFEGAYKMVDDLEKMNFKPTTAMYNAIMAGYFREKNISGGLRVLKHMQDANVKPDSQTFSYLISNCEAEEDIIKYYEELKQSGIQASKQIFMALVSSYAACGNLEKAKQVVSDPNIPMKYLNEIKSVLVSALALHGKLSEALLVYEEIKNAGYNLEPKAILNLIDEVTQFDGELDGLLVLLTELSDPNYWVEGCFKVIMYCIRTKHLSAAIDLFKQLKGMFVGDELVMEALFDAVFSRIAESQSTHLQIGLDLLWAIKDELGLVPSRQCLDFLLTACANTGDLNNARLIWREYEVAGFPYNVLSYLRMYQALLASGDHGSAKIMLKKIPKDDVDVCYVIKAIQDKYDDLTHVGKKKKKRGKKKEKRES